MKPIVELLTELQTAVAKAETDQAALQAAQAEGTKKVEAAKATFDKVATDAKAKVDAAAAKSADSSAYVRTLQDEVNSVLGRFDPRVRVG
jgi:hypothetical protein